MCHKTSTFYFHCRIKLQFLLQIIATTKKRNCCSIDCNSIPARESCRFLWISYYEPLCAWIVSYFETLESRICFLLFYLKQVSLTLDYFCFISCEQFECITSIILPNFVWQLTICYVDYRCYFTIYNFFFSLIILQLYYINL